MPDLDSVVKVEIDGNRFDIPLRYMYGDTLEKWGNWPKPKKDRVKVDVVGISVLMPGLRPYYPEDSARWKVLGHGDRIEVAIRKPIGSPDWFEGVVGRNLEAVSQGKTVQKPDAFDLKVFQETGQKIYFPTDDRQLIIRCHTMDTVSSPSCKVKSNYQKGVVFEYFFGLSYLQKWMEIDNGIKMLADKFARAASMP